MDAARRRVSIKRAMLVLFGVAVAGTASGQYAPQQRTRIVGPRWDHPNLTYFFVGDTPALPGTSEYDEVISAMGHFSQYSNLTFSPASTESAADIVIRFVEQAYSCPLQSTHNTAHAFYPPPHYGEFAGEIHVPRDKAWNLIAGDPDDFVLVARHELGHAIGLSHAGSQDDLMGKGLTPPARALSPHEQALLEVLYAIDDPVDLDGDSVDDAEDNCLGVYNPLQVDSDWDGYGDACDGDINQDGVYDDTSHLGSHWTSLLEICVGNPGYSPFFDHDSDGCLEYWSASEQINAVKNLNPSAPSGLACADRFDSFFNRPCWVSGQAGDQDDDGFPNAEDNCEFAPNAIQIDLDLDGIGNACDADYDQDGAVTPADFGVFLSVLGSCPSAPLTIADHDGDLCITPTDFNFFLGQLGNPSVRGPSGLACADPTIDITSSDTPCIP